MSEVKRYTVGMDFNGGSPGLEDESGEFIYAYDDADELGRRGHGKHWQVVRASDYDAALAKIETLKRALTDSLLTIQRGIYRCGPAKGIPDSCVIERSALSAASEIVKAAFAAVEDGATPQKG